MRQTVGTFSAGGTDLRQGVVVRRYALPDGTPLPPPGWPPPARGGRILGAAPNGPGFAAVAQGGRLLSGNQILREIDVSRLLPRGYDFHAVAAERRTGRLALLSDRLVVPASRTGEALATIPLDHESHYWPLDPFHVEFVTDGRRSETDA